MEKFQKISAEIQKQSVNILNTRKGRFYKDKRSMMSSYRVIMLFDPEEEITLSQDSISR